MSKINNSVKKILLIGIPIILVLIAVSLSFYMKANEFSNLNKQTTDSELIAYTIEVGSFKSEEAVESTEENKQYQTKIIFQLHNKAKYDLGYFDISVQFIEEDSDELWTYTQEDFSFYTDGKLIISNLRPNKATGIENVYIEFADDDKQIYLHENTEYEKLFGKTNKIVSPTTLKVYNTLTLACIIFTLVIALAIGALIIVYTRPEEDELLNKITQRPKRSSESTYSSVIENKVANVESKTIKKVTSNSTSRKTTTQKKNTSPKTNATVSHKTTTKSKSIKSSSKKTN